MAIHKGAALIGAAALALTVSACDRYGKTGEAPKADSGAIEDAIKADEKAWNEQFAAKNLDGLAGHYADDAYFVVPGMKGVSGSTEIRKAYANALNDPNFAVSFASDRIDVAQSGDLAYSRGHFTEKYTDPKTKKVVSDGGSYVTIYKKQSDGSWKAVEDFTAIEPAEAPAG